MVEPKPERSARFSAQYPAMSNEANFGPIRFEILMGRGVKFPRLHMVRTERFPIFLRVRFRKTRFFLAYTQLANGFANSILSLRRLMLQNRMEVSDRPRAGVAIQATDLSV
jgi:hypothetical protein